MQKRETKLDSQGLMGRDVSATLHKDKHSWGGAGWGDGSGGGGGGGKRRGLGPRNDVLTTCKAVTPQGGQQSL